MYVVSCIRHVCFHSSHRILRHRSTEPEQQCRTEICNCEVQCLEQVQHYSCLSNPIDIDIWDH